MVRSTDRGVFASAIWSRYVHAAAFISWLRHLSQPNTDAQSFFLPSGIRPQCTPADGHGLGAHASEGTLPSNTSQRSPECSSQSSSSREHCPLSRAATPAAGSRARQPAWSTRAHRGPEARRGRHIRRAARSCHGRTVRPLAEHARAEHTRSAPPLSRLTCEARTRPGPCDSCRRRPRVGGGR